MFSQHSRELNAEGLYGGFSFRLNVPAAVFSAKDTKKFVTDSIRRINRDFTRNFVRRIQADLGAANRLKSSWYWKFRDSWHVESSAAAREGEYRAGVWTDDPVYPYYEFFSHPNGLPPWGEGSPIAIWVEGLLINPLPPWTTPIRPYQVAQSVAASGAGGHEVVKSVLEESEDEYVLAIDNVMRMVSNGSFGGAI